MYCNFESSHLAEWGNCLPYPYHTLHNNGTSGGNFCTDHHHHQHRQKHHSSLVVHDTGQGTYFGLLYVRTLDGLLFFIFKQIVINWNIAIESVSLRNFICKLFASSRRRPIISLFPGHLFFGHPSFACCPKMTTSWTNCVCLAHQLQPP